MIDERHKDKNWKLPTNAKGQIENWEAVTIAVLMDIPTWDELRDIRYALLPNEKTFGILLPPKEQYVNVHENCFHLDEIPSVHEETKSLLRAIKANTRKPKRKKA